ncbi:epoxyqueuosine reductase [Lacrimispora algidixylanolytica]|uniref:Fe-S oxidoreductase n=1 Tax=Lacrimispora algidixylanolytica TaxID=94868 RepID=A0A419T369_9FIRM|nr:epoxyqueuosine reductase [Lacrimispora algidixylanolytica]RKD31879.1 Fe-S oxidoreductase [Lacrimispora algidixylanolytica]
MSNVNFSDNSMENQIQRKALELGYEKCGIIPVDMMEGYGEKLDERIEKATGSGQFYQGQKRLKNFQEQYPWAKSIIVLTVPYSQYKVPEEISGHIAKAYLFDTRIDEQAEEYQHSQLLENHLKELGLRVETNRKFGVVALRWAAMKAGLGIIRRNNFFYTESGSWIRIEAFLTDQKMELLQQTTLPACPKHCDRCIKACPTTSLCEAYTMNPLSCVSFLTTFGGRDLPNEPMASNFGDWIYGCDICQEVCPMNQGKWKGDKDFPGVMALSPYLTAENILKMDESYYQQNVQPKFFYLSQDELWKWQVDALNFMDNRYQEHFNSSILEACESKYEQVREMADTVCKKHGLT